MTVDIDELNRWVGREQTVADVITPTPMARLSATLDRADPPPQPGTGVPPLWHWLYFLEAVPASALTADGHCERGGFVPPVPLPRRMWAGSRFRFLKPLHVGAKARRESRCESVTAKRGRSGELVFVTLRHAIVGPDGPAVEEEQDLVFREAPRPGESARPPEPAPAGPWQRRIEPDPVLLFRYSALTFNGHRIHYDHAYATGEEGYPGLVVHGPLIATLMLDLLRRKAPEAELAAFAFQARRPIFATGPFTVGGAPPVNGGPCRLWATDNDGWLAAEGTAELAG